MIEAQETTAPRAGSSSSSVARSSSRLLGSRRTLPVEVVPFGAALCHERLEQLGLRPVMRARDQAPETTDNGNWILDLPARPDRRSRAARARRPCHAGRRADGSFLGMVHTVLVENDGQVEIRVCPGTAVR